MIGRIAESRSRVAFVFALVAVSVVGGMVLGQYGGSAVVRSRGTVKTVGVGVYWDGDCSIPVSTIDWGMLEPGSKKTVSFYIRNEGNTEITLSASIENWDPEAAARYITLTWACDELGLNPTSALLKPNQIIRVTLTLSLSWQVTDITDFTFHIIIIGKG